MPLKGLTQEAAREILRRCDELGAISEESDRLTRRYLSSAMDEAMEKTAGWMQQAGLETEMDTAGNLIGSYRCGLPNAPMLVLGSHLDTVRDAGKYDGPLGVLTAVAVAEWALVESSSSRSALAAAAWPFDLDVIAFADEEGLRFGAPFLGSKALIGELELSALDLCDAEGCTLRDLLATWNARSPELPLPYRYSGRRMLGYVETHIEQGPALEGRDLSLGILEAIAASCWMRLSLKGRAGHAGTTPMNLRLDPMPAAAEIVLEAERLARADGDLVATVGRLDTNPGAGNVIPGSVETSLDMRHADCTRLKAAVTEMLASCQRIAARRGLELTTETLNFEEGVTAAPELSETLLASAAAAGIAAAPLIVGAGHDALIMARRMPMSMLLVRSPGGLSHHPEEAVRPQDVDAAFRVVCGLLERLAAREGSQDSDSALSPILPAPPLDSEATETDIREAEG